jgi:hypothetical protein
MTFQAYLDTIKEKTGLGPDEFLELAKERGLLVPGVPAAPVIAWLEADYGLGRGHAMALVSVFRGRLDDRGPSKEQRIDKHFAGAKSTWQLTYDEIMATVMKLGPDVSVEPADSYISILRGKSKFAVVATTATRMDVGLKLKGEPAGGRLTLSGSWNGMVTHRVRLSAGAELDDQLAAWLREAYDRVA